MKIRKINKIDIPDISTLHKKIFDKSYFSVHYPVKLLNKYFESLVSMNEYNYIVEDDDNEPIGFLIGGYRTQSAVDDFMQKNSREVLFCMIKYPKFIIIGIGKLLRKFHSKKIKSKAQLRLFLIGVNPEANKKGAGSLLISSFEEALKKDSIDLYGLYVRTDNPNAIQFYERRGFVYEFKKHNLISYTKTIPKLSI